jgi:hypothetical protein
VAFFVSGGDVGVGWVGVGSVVTVVWDGVALLVAVLVVI